MTHGDINHEHGRHGDSFHGDILHEAVQYNAAIQWTIQLVGLQGPNGDKKHGGICC